MKPNSMKPFLYSIAQAYLEAEPKDVSDYCFVFPNKRSGVFFHHDFGQASKAMGIKTAHPASMTITDFIEGIVPGKPAERLEMVFILYRAYREVIFRHGGGSMEARELAGTVDFNRFQRWADTILGDFNDVDMYLVDPASLFPNLERYREISANYLDPEVIEEIKRHWRIDRIPEFNDNFWNHITHPSSTPNESPTGSALRFFRLWQVMLDLYLTFRRMMKEKGLFYPGMAYRQATEIIKTRNRSGFPYRRYIFAGFNMLSKVEEKIFTLMKGMRGESQYAQEPFADFYFDNASPAFKMKGNTTAGFLARYTQLFPSLYDCVEPVEDFPRIEITGIASRTGQAKLAGAIAGILYPENGLNDPASLRRTAIILPQESMARGVVSAIPGWISPVNLTMGYRLRDSRAASLVRDIVSLHLRSRKNRGVSPTFFHEDVFKVLTHPLIRQICPAECSRMVYDINVNRIYNVEAAYIAEKYPTLTPVFSYVEDSASTEAVLNYFNTLFRWLLAAERNTAGSAEEYTDIDGATVSGVKTVAAMSVIDRMLTKAYLRGIARLQTLASQYLRENDIFLADTTIFHLLERLIGGETVNFEGRPLNGLQVMGVLEARSLDFENIIIPSMNERIFPRKHYQKSFIPPHLRIAYGMSTQEHQESIYSYYFYRMISRAKRVFLLYDARTQGVGSGQMSRYLEQLIHLYRPPKLSVRVIGHKVEPQAHSDLHIKKTPEIMEVLERYRSADNPRYLSASAINQYINCPLSFYLSYIAGYKREDELHDYMDESTFGTIMHGIFEDLFASERYNLPDGLFTPQAITALKKKTVLIEQTITRRINRHYLMAGEDNLTPLKGDAEIFGEIMKKYVLMVLDREIEAGTFEYLAGEYGTPGPLAIKGAEREMVINFRFSIDRIDRLVRPDGSSVLRIIDYKTGTDTDSIIEVKDMFTARGKSSTRAKAIMQLFLYCQALAQRKNLDEPIQPWLYLIRKVATKPFTPLQITDPSTPAGTKARKIDITDYRDYVTEFNDQMIDVLDDFFNEEIPFEAAKDSHACTFCKFTEICRRT